MVGAVVGVVIVRPWMGELEVVQRLEAGGACKSHLFVRNRVQE